jgi:uncharacterized membrane protein YbhN (UPF0104 family)
MKREVLEKLVITIVLAASGIYFYRELPSFIALVRKINASTLALVFGTLILQWILRAWRDRELLRIQKHSMPYFPLFYINNSQTLLNYLPFKAGTITAGHWLKKNFKVPYKSYFVSLVFQNLLTLVAAGFFSLLIMLGHRGFASSSGKSLALLFFGIAMASLLVLLFGGQLLRIQFIHKLPEKYRAHIKDIGSSLSSFKKEGPTAAKIFILSVLGFVVGSYRLLLLWQTTPTHIDLPESIIMGTMAQIGVLLSITPAALGFREFFLGAASSTLSADFKSGVLISALERILVLVAVGLAQLIFWFPFQNALKRRSQKEPST